MTFALRAFWVVSPNEESPVFCRVFPTVELRAKKTENYQPLPEQNKFVEAILAETGIKNSDIFLPSRDRCDKKCIAPAFQICDDEVQLEPVVILQHRGLLLCALPLVEDPECSTLEVAQTLDCLNTIAERLTGDLSQRNDLRNQLTRLMVANFPFGRPQTENAALTEYVIAATLKETSQDKVKVPIWNSSPNPKGKNIFAFLVSEQIHLSGTGEEAFATGVISVTTTETCETQPEVKFTISHPSSLKNFSTAPRCQVENASASSTTFKFSPTVGIKMDLIHYTLACSTPLDCSATQRAGRYKLTVKPLKSQLQRLEIKIPTTGKIQFVVGAACEVSKATKWDIPPSKLKSKSAEIEIASSTDTAKKIVAEATFKTSTDSCWSGLKVMQNSLTVNEKTSKIKFSTVSETVSGVYRIECST